MLRTFRLIYVEITPRTNKNNIIYIIHRSSKNEGLKVIENSLSFRRVKLIKIQSSLGAK